jgi:hypothetical protein
MPRRSRIGTGNLSTEILTPTFPRPLKLHFSHYSFFLLTLHLGVDLRISSVSGLHSSRLSKETQQ